MQKRNLDLDDDPTVSFGKAAFDLATQTETY